MSKKDYQPVFIMPEQSIQNTGKSAQKNNILAAKLVAESVRTTLGPKGMDKLLVNSMNDIIITNDGVTILQEMEIEHPVAKMIVEIARTQESEVGDGTTTAVIIAGELLKHAEVLLDRNIHPTVLNKGYRLAAVKAAEILKELATTVDTKDTETLKKIVTTAMTGKGAEVAKDLLSEIVVESVRKVSKIEGASRSDIKVETRVGEGVENSELISGIILDKERVHPDMPSKITNAKVALLNCSLEIRDTETDAKISINSPAQMQQFLDQEEQMIHAITDSVIKSGANVVFCQKGIDDLAQYFLAKEGILAVRRVAPSDMKRLAKATGAKIVFDVHDLSENRLGSAALVEEKKLHDESLLFVTGTKNDVVATILVSGGTPHIVDEVKRAVEDAIGDLFSVIKNKKVVSGAGAIEVEISRQLLQYAKTLSGREQLAVKSFAEALEIIPKTLAENAGLDPIDILTELNASHEKGNAQMGIDVFSGELINAWDEGILEPVSVKLQAIRSAAEVASMILRIDDVIITNPEKPQNPSLSMPDY